MAGFGDGAVRVYDRRLPPRDCMVKVWKDHRSWIVKAHMQRGGMRELVTGSVTGEVKLWDIRMDAPVQAFVAHEKGMRNLAVHEHAPVIATWVLPHLNYRHSTNKTVAQPITTSSFGTLTRPGSPNLSPPSSQTQAFSSRIGQTQSRVSHSILTA